MLKYVLFTILKVTRCLFTLVEFEGAALSREIQYGKTRDADENGRPWTLLLKKVIGHKPTLVRSHARVPGEMLSPVIEKKPQVNWF